MAKDLFSAQAKAYSQFRPHYPDELYEYILSFVTEKNNAWDCATGNGQAAAKLAHYFNHVAATDISEAQLALAPKHQNIEYSLSSAERTVFPDNTFDLITVAQAYHWFDHELFHKEVNRVGKKDSVIAVWLYDRFSTGMKAFDDLMDDFYWNITGPYWDKARKFIDDHYATLPFPFAPLPAKKFEVDLYWTLDHVIGFLGSWSAVQQYIKMQQFSPLSLVEEKMRSLWGSQKERKVTFPIFLQLGRIKK